MIYRLETYDYPAKAWKPTNKFKSSVSRISKGYQLDKTHLVYSYIPRGLPVAPTCLAKWLD